MSITVITAVLQPAASYLLTDLPTAKNELGIDLNNTKDDIYLTRTLAEVSDSIHRYCNRVFPLETVQDVLFPERDAYPWQVPGGVPKLQLSRWPLATNRATITLSAPVESGNVLPCSSTDGVAVGMPAAADGIETGSYVTAVATGASVTISSPVCEPLGAGATVWCGLTVVVEDPPGTRRTMIPGRDYLADQEAGLLTRLDKYQHYPVPWYPIKTTVTYQGGFATIPGDLVGATLRVITQRFAAKGRDPTMKSWDQPNIGTQSFWVGSIPGVRGAFPEEIADILSRYRVPVTA